MRLKIASLLGLLSKTQGFSPDCIVDDFISTLTNESKIHLCAPLTVLFIIGSYVTEYLNSSMLDLTLFKKQNKNNSSCEFTVCASGHLLSVLVKYN